MMAVYRTFQQTELDIQYTARTGAPDWESFGCAVSGIYDLEPVRLSTVNEWAKLDAEAIRPD